jgi:hypothetical protein
LDLLALERRAASAADVIGLPMGQVTVAVVPAVRFDAGGSFAPRLELVLDALVVKPRGGLSASRPIAVAAHRRESAQLSLMGRSFDVTTGRRAGGAAVGFGALLALLWALGSRLVGPVPEVERIRTRYRDLLVPVLPMTLDPDRAVVDVPDVASLARLADRSGLPLLHWSQGEQHTFVVHDEGTTFRWRSGASHPATRPALGRIGTGPGRGRDAAHVSRSATRAG